MSGTDCNDVSHCECVDDLWSRIGLLESKLAAAEADAERLNWWEANPGVEILADDRYDPEKWLVITEHEDEYGDPVTHHTDTLREAIDAARGVRDA